MDEVLLLFFAVFEIFDSILQIHIIALLAFIIFGIIIIMLTPAVQLALVWFCTGSPFWAGIAFLVIAAYPYQRNYDSELFRLFRSSFKEIINF